MLRGEVKPVSEYTEEEIGSMYSLMDEFYDNVTESTFRNDFLIRITVWRYITTNRDLWDSRHRKSCR